MADSFQLEQERSFLPRWLNPLPVIGMISENPLLGLFDVDPWDTPDLGGHFLPGTLRHPTQFPRIQITEAAVGPALCRDQSVC